MGPAGVEDDDGRFLWSMGHENALEQDAPFERAYPVTSHARKRRSPRESLSSRSESKISTLI
jgi:hypothetical protein